jgi:hypothetical protein
MQEKERDVEVLESVEEQQESPVLELSDEQKENVETIINKINKNIIKPAERIIADPKILEAKNKARELVNTLKGLQKKAKKKTKKSEKVIKIAEAFINCHATNPAVYDKYKALQNIVKLYKRI